MMLLFGQHAHAFLRMMLPVAAPLPAIVANVIARRVVSHGGSMRPCSTLRFAVLLAVVLLIAGCATLRTEVERIPSQAWPHPEDTTLGKNAAAKLAASHGDSGFLLLDSGMDALAARGALAELAEHTLDLQYYIVRESATTQLLIYRVLRAAERGIRVHLLVDDLSAAGKELHLDELAAHPNIQVRVFTRCATSTEWLEQYNEIRPHDALGSLPPAQYRERLLAAETPV